jgi:ribosomal protein L7/L12/DNA-binding beta-propeller fold protein YncE
MSITKETMRDQLLAYLNGTLPLAQLVDWAEEAARHGDFDPQDAEVLRDIIAKLSMADVRQAGPRWEDAHELLARLGYQAQVGVLPASLPPAQPDPTAEMQQLLRDGRKIEAIKVYRRVYGVGLKEAKDAVERLEPGQGLPGWPTPSPSTGATPGGSPLFGRLFVLIIGIIAVAWLLTAISGGDNGLTAFFRRMSPPPSPTATHPPAPTRAPTPTPAPTATSAPTATPRFFDVHILVGCMGIARGCFDVAQTLGVDSQGNIYAGDDSDFVGGRVQVFDPTGKFITQWLVGDKNTDLRRIAVDRQGAVYVVSDGDIYRFQGASGKLLGKLEYTGGQGFQDVATTADGELVAAWNKDWRGGVFVNFKESQDDIVVFDSAGKVEKVFPKALSGIAGGDAELDTWLTVDKQGNIYAAGIENQGIYKFAPDGKFLGKFAEDRVRGGAPLAVDAQGRMIAAVGSDMLIFAPDGSFLGSEDWSANDMVFNDRNELLTIDDSEIKKFVLMR